MELGDTVASLQPLLKEDYTRNSPRSPVLGSGVTFLTFCSLFPRKLLNFIISIYRLSTNIIRTLKKAKASTSNTNGNLIIV